MRVEEQGALDRPRWDPRSPRPAWVAVGVAALGAPAAAFALGLRGADAVRLWLLTAALGAVLGALPAGVVLAIDLVRRRPVPARAVRAIVVPNLVGFLLLAIATS